MQAVTPAYSRLISCIYDEPGPVGQIGRGAHYSIFRAAEWRDVMRRPLSVAQVHDFAVIWDEDHDTRVIEAIEKLYVNSLLSPVQFIGERKGGLTLVLAAEFYHGIDVGEFDEYRTAAVAAVGQICGDDWAVCFGSFDRSEPDHRTDFMHIIQDSEFRVKTYLRNIDILWGLGARDYEPPPLLDAGFMDLWEDPSESFDSKDPPA